MTNKDFVAYRTRLFNYDAAYLREHRQFAPWVTLRQRPVNAEEDCENRQFLSVDSIYYPGVMDFIAKSVQRVNGYVVMNVYDTSITRKVNLYGAEGHWIYDKDKDILRMSPSDNYTPYEHPAPFITEVRDQVVEWKGSLVYFKVVKAIKNSDHSSIVLFSVERAIKKEVILDLEDGTHKSKCDLIAQVAKTYMLSSKTSTTMTCTNYLHYHFK